MSLDANYAVVLHSSIITSPLPLYDTVCVEAQHYMAQTVHKSTALYGMIWQRQCIEMQHCMAQTLHRSITLYGKDSA